MFQQLASAINFCNTLPRLGSVTGAALRCTSRASSFFPPLFYSRNLGRRRPGLHA